MKRTSVDEFSAVSQESCITPTINPTPTTCIATSFGIPNKLHASGINNNDPPATPDAPQALTADSNESNKAIPISTCILSVCTAARVNIDIVIAAPPIFIVAPSGIDTE